MRTLLSLLSLIGLLASSTVEAQNTDPAEFFPYAPGNEWEYVQTYSDLLEDPPAETVTGYTRVVVLRDTVVSGLPGVVLTVTRLDDAQEQTSELTCTGYLDGSTWKVLPRECMLGGRGTSGSYYLSEKPGGPIEVGGETYVVPALSDFGIPCGTGPGGAGCEERWKHAAGIGLYYWEERSYRILAPAWSSRKDGRLTYARVGGEVFGAPVVANESVPDAALGVLAVAAFPNPSRGQVRVSVAGAVTGPVELALYDMLGRRVWTSRSGPAGGAVLDMGPLPHGVYVLRVRDRSGAAAATRVTRLD